MAVEGQKLREQVARTTLIRNFYFQLASLYALVGGGTFWASARQIVMKPFCAGQILALSIPKVAVYFTTFVIARVGYALLWILQLDRVCVGLCGTLRRASGKLVRLCICCGPRRKKEPAPPLEPVACWIGYEVTPMAIVLVIANMYSIIMPLVMPTCALYFAVASCMYRWLFISVYTQDFDCEGAFWYEIFNGSMVGLHLGALVVCGIVMGRRPLSLQMWTAWLLPVLTIRFQVRCNARFQPLASAMSLEDAVAVDRRMGPTTEGCSPDYYVDPIDKLDLQEVDSDDEPDRLVPKGQDGLGSGAYARAQECTGSGSSDDESCDSEVTEPSVEAGAQAAMEEARAPPQPSFVSYRPLLGQLRRLATPLPRLL